MHLAAIITRSWLELRPNMHLVAIITRSWLDLRITCTWQQLLQGPGCASYASGMLLQARLYAMDKTAVKWGWLCALSQHDVQLYFWSTSWRVTWVCYFIRRWLTDMIGRGSHTWSSMIGTACYKVKEFTYSYIVVRCYTQLDGCNHKNCSFNLVDPWWAALGSQGW